MHSCRSRRSEIAFLPSAVNVCSQRSRKCKKCNSDRRRFECRLVPRAHFQRVCVCVFVVIVRARSEMHEHVGEGWKMWENMKMKR